MLEGVQKRKYRGESQGSARKPQRASRKLKEPLGGLKGAAMTDRKLEQKCGVTHFKATGLKEGPGGSRRAAGEDARVRGGAAGGVGGRAARGARQAASEVTLERLRFGRVESRFGRANPHQLASAISLPLTPV